MAQESEELFARASAAIAASRRLTAEKRILLDAMTSLYEQRMLSAMKTANRLKLSERLLVERYKRLTRPEAERPHRYFVAVRSRQWLCPPAE